jgi:uncharacterized SAM-binding protein YcdF (DUF218 family)
LIRILKKILRWTLGLSGAAALLFVALSFTDLPYLAYHRLGVSSDSLQGQPGLIVLLGGAGMPSPDGLMRCWYAAEAAHRFPGAPVVIALPANDDGTLRQLDLMARELVLKGVDSSRIRYEPRGHNTRSQAVNIAAGFDRSRKKPSVLVVTSPEHLYRAARVFKKAGFYASGLPAFEKPVDERQARAKGRAAERQVSAVSLRYNMWSYMNYELIVAREYLAICYYKWKGWI